MAKRIGFVHYDKEKPAKEIRRWDSQVEMALDAYFCNESDSGRFTSEEIALNLRETIKISPSQVFAYMSSHGYRLERVDDRLVWVID